MKQTHIILIGILILGIFLFAILGEKLWREGMQGTFSGTFNVNNPNPNPNGPPPPSSSSSSSSSSGSSGASTPSSVQYDNYNHFTQSSTQLPSGTTFYGENGGNVYVTTNSDGTQTLTVTLSTGQTPLIFTSTQSGNSTGSTTNSSSMAEGYTNYGNSNTGNASATTFSGPMGDTATILTTTNGQKAVNVQTSEGAYTFGSSGSIYNPNNTSNTGLNSTQYYGSTGSPIQTGDSALAYQGPYGANGVAVSGQNNTAYYAEGPQGNSVSGVYPNDNNNNNTINAGAVTGPQGNTAFYASGQNGTVAGTTTNNNSPTYTTAPLQGIPKSQIPAGSEDLYILKSEAFPITMPPPVIIPASSSENCPKPICPGCKPCKYPPVTCKAVPDYNNIEDQYLPSPVLNDFSQFGM
jgi:hypothetical protein